MWCEGVGKHDQPLGSHCCTWNSYCCMARVESVQDFLIKLDMKPCMHLVEISIFFTKSCHRQTYQNYEQPPQTSQNLYFQSHFFVFKIGQIFQKKIL